MHVWAGIALHEGMDSFAFLLGVSELLQSLSSGQEAEACSSQPSVRASGWIMVHS